MNGLRERNMVINDYILKPKMLTDQLDATCIGIFDDEKLMAILNDLD